MFLSRAYLGRQVAKQMGRGPGGAGGTHTRSSSAACGSGTWLPSSLPDRTAVTQRVEPSQLYSRLRPPPLPGPGASSLEVALIGAMTKSLGGNFCVLLTAGDLLDGAPPLAGTVVSTGGQSPVGREGSVS